MGEDMVRNALAHARASIEMNRELLAAFANPEKYDWTGEELHSSSIEPIPDRGSTAVLKGNEGTWAEFAASKQKVANIDGKETQSAS